MVAGHAWGPPDFLALAAKFGAVYLSGLRAFDVGTLRLLGVVWVQCSVGAVQCGCSAVWVQILISCVLQVKEMDEARRAVLLIDATYEVRAHNGSCCSERS